MVPLDAPFIYNGVSYASSYWNCCLYCTAETAVEIYVFLIDWVWGGGVFSPTVCLGNVTQTRELIISFEQNSMLKLENGRRNGEHRKFYRVGTRTYAGLDFRSARVW